MGLGRGRAQGAKPDSRHHHHAGQGEGRRGEEGEGRQAGQGAVSAKNLAVFHAAVLGDDSDAGPAAGPVLGHPRQTRETTRISPPVHFWATRTRSRVGAASLADAMRKHPKTFDPLFTNMIGRRRSGRLFLDTILKRLATYIEKAVKLKARSSPR